MSVFRRGALIAGLLTSLLIPGALRAQSDDLVQLDFRDVELTVIIDTIAKVTGKNFIYDDRVRGRVTIISPTKVTVDQAYAVFESVLKVKGFTAVPGPGDVFKIIPIRDAKESSIETVKDDRRSPNRDTFVTRLIPLLYISAEAITNTIKPLVSKDASMVAYAPTNTIIVTDTAANIRRLLSILEAIDVETHKEELAVIQVEFADAATLGQQLSEIYDAEVTSASPAPTRRRPRGRRAQAAQANGAQASTSTNNVRIITDDRTNSLLVLAARSQIQDIRELVRKLDVPVVGQGRIHVYYLKHADAEELSQTITALLSGQRAGSGPGGQPGAGGAQPQALRSAVTELAEGITVTADPQTNSLLIQASREAYETLKQVIEKLDTARPQVLVEALIMEVDLQDGLALGMGFVIDIVNGNYTLNFSTLTDSAISGAIDSAATSGSEAALGPAAAGPFAARAIKRLPADGEGTAIAGVIRAAANDDRINILSAPHILTSDNEEAEIKIGNNIPIITSRVSSAQTTSANNLATSVNVERQDIGVTLRVTPQISEGDTLRLKIFQEITDVNETLSETTGSAEDVGVALLSRRIENTVVVADGETVIVGGLIGEVSEDNEVKIPFFGDIPFLGWAFKSIERRTRKENLLVFLTPHIVRDPERLESETIKRRERFLQRTDQFIGSVEHQEEEIQYSSDMRGVRYELRKHSQRYPLERMAEIEVASLAEDQAQREAAEREAITRYAIQAGIYSDEDEAAERLTDVLDRGIEATLVSSEVDGILLFEIVVGPYETIHRAEDVSEVLRRALDFEPTIRVVTLENP